MKVIGQLLVLLALTAFSCTGPQAPSPSVTTPQTKSNVPSPVLTQPSPGSRCPRRPAGGYGITFTGTSGTAGSILTATGPIPHYRENGSYARAGGGIQIWWNVSPKDWAYLTPGSTVQPSPAASGEVRLLASLSSGSACRFTVAFRVPEAIPGSYPILVLETGRHSATLYDHIVFHITT